MDVRRLPPVAATLSFIDRINHGDVDGLAKLMTENHVLKVFAEEPVVGREANIEAWRGYATAFPTYVIYPQRIAGRGANVAILGHTTGSHLLLPDDEEAEVTLIWIATVSDGRIQRWELVNDTAVNRALLGLTD